MHIQGIQSPRRAIRAFFILVSPTHYFISYQCTLDLFLDNPKHKIDYNGAQ